ncbi:hypothetical protein VFPBJ_09278 [Purpureocillium lilacinum]|uniref:25S rRNA (Uridine(2843)-N(3))-methyltransferase n=1 Tax=Purpureocillium lilacinum TaxID=33203 RepID=A0A179GD30_PURLI|nr:hypothetical protein VFPBJ_09278 [Purpureocillium lilacinum]GJN76314.1 hypothetical protein PLICBS_010426 [Purpureocillium lilacinum]
MGGRRATASKRKPPASAGGAGRQPAGGPAAAAAAGLDNYNDGEDSRDRARKQQQQQQQQQQKHHQQRLLNVFSDAFAAVLARDSFPTILQEIKQALYNRDFAAAFGRQDYLEAYAARWSPTRALCYAAVFRGIRGHLDAVVAVDETEAMPSRDAAAEGVEEPSASDYGASPPARRLRMLCFGGCAAEHVAFASYLRETASSGTVTLVDSAPWSQTASLLQQHLTSPPPLSKYASAAARAANTALLDDDSQLRFAFCQEDALSLGRDRLAELVVGATGTSQQQQPQRPLVVTLMFTLNELYTDGGIGRTTKFLRLLGEVLPEGSLLLVVDSPGSYSEAAVGKEDKKKKYPMQWLLNHTLLGTETVGYTWEGIESEDSIWFRLPEGLDYPIPLENMRYQMHLYRIHKSKS